jgi:hypothetical protein
LEIGEVSDTRKRGSMVYPRFEEAIFAVFASRA